MLASAWCPPSFPDCHREQALFNGGAPTLRTHRVRASRAQQFEPVRPFVQRHGATVSVAHQLSGLDSTRVVRFSVLPGRRDDEPDDMATGSQDDEVFAGALPLADEDAFGGGSG